MLFYIQTKIDHKKMKYFKVLYKKVGSSFNFVVVI